MILVRLSANCAPLWTHRSWIPSDRRSLIFRALSWVRNSLQAGGAVRVTKSKRLLQSVATVSSVNLWAFIVAVEKDWGNMRNAASGFCHRTFESINHAQHKRIHESWSKTELRDTVSAASVLVTTRCIFLHPHEIGLTKQVVLFPISLWVLMMTQPVCESGFFLDENDASEKARKRRSSHAIGWIVMDTLECFLASWSVLLASRSVATVALLIEDCKWLSLLARSGRVWTDAYWRLPIRPRKAKRSSGLMFSVSSFRRSIDTLIGWIFFTYSACDIVIDLFGCWNMSIPVNVNWPTLCDPKG